MNTLKYLCALTLPAVLVNCDQRPEMEMPKQAETRSGKGELLETYTYYLRGKEVIYHGERVLLNPIMGEYFTFVQQFDNGVLISTKIKRESGELVPIGKMDNLTIDKIGTDIKTMK